MKFEDVISNLGFEAVDIQRSIDNVSDVDENICIPAGWFVYTVCLDAEEPYCIICNNEDVNEEEKIKVPKSLAYYLSTHFCGSQKMHDNLIESGKQQLRNQIKNILGVV